MAGETGGFEVLQEISHHNAEAFWQEFDSWPEEKREGIPLELWRALPDSPGA